MASAEKWVLETAGFAKRKRFMVRAALRDRTGKFISIPLTQFRLEALMSAVAEKQLIMLKLVDQTPVLAGCSGCNLKFFVPKGLMKDSFEANNCLLSKFDRHVCTGEAPPPKKCIDKLGGCKFEIELMQKAAERRYTRGPSWQHWPGLGSGQKL
jgi:hypothetical protein